MKNLLRIAIYQFSSVVGDLNYNTQSLIASINQAKDNGCDLFICPELCLTGYPPEDLLFRNDFKSNLELQVDKFYQIKGITILLPLPTYNSNTNEIYNSVVIIHDGITLAKYDKMILPNYGVFDDKRYFTAGNQAVTFECNGYRVGVIICEDMWSDKPARMASGLGFGLDLLCVVNASPFEIDKHNQRLSVARERVTENSVALLYVNCVGGQDELVYDGGSFLMDKFGSVCYQADSFRECLDFIDFNSEDMRIKNDLIIPYPQEEVAVYTALKLALKDYVVRNGFSGVILGLSGGVDSALVLTIASDALGSENVCAVMMPSVYTSEISLIDSRKIIENLAIPVYHEIDIMNIFTQFNLSLAGVFDNRQTDTTEENLQARIRGVILMAISNKLGYLVVSTGNKSEMAVGYATLYGDMVGGFALLKDIPKTLVYRLCVWRNSLGSVIPERILTRAPSAELRANQIDQDSLPDYSVLDCMIEELVDNNRSVTELADSGFNLEELSRVARLIKLNEYKRRQSALGPKITKRSFAKDWRYPITSGYSF